MSTTTLDKATADALTRLRVMAFATARQGGASKTEPLVALGWTVSLRVTCDNPLNERTCVLNASAKADAADRAGLRVILDALGAPSSNQTDSGGFYSPPRFSSWEGPAPGGLVTSVVTWRPFHDDTKIGRNDPCPCGSGKKWKKCCSP